MKPVRVSIPVWVLLIPALILGFCSDDDSPSETLCEDGLDNDRDGVTDCDDEDCVADPACQPECGNGVVEGSEQCDGSDLGETTRCVDLDGEFIGGTLSCDASRCAYDTSQCEEAPPCSDAAFTAEGALCVADELGGEYEWQYEEQVVAGAERYILRLELYDAYVTGGVTTGSHELGVGDEANYASCAYCVRLFHCDAEAQPACSATDHQLFAREGTLVLTELGLPDVGHLTGTLQDVGWEEVTIGSDYTSTPVLGGACLNLTADHTVDASVSQAP